MHVYLLVALMLLRNMCLILQQRPSHDRSKRLRPKRVQVPEKHKGICVYVAKLYPREMGSVVARLLIMAVSNFRVALATECDQLSGD
jgi:hypothetical protein